MKDDPNFIRNTVFKNGAIKQELKSKLNSYITPFSSKEMMQQYEGDKSESTGELDGVLVSIKDNFNLKNVLCTASSSILSNFKL